jgi:tetratricopeptide (TPR) repeat protein
VEEAGRFFEETGDAAALATVWEQLAELEWMPCRYERAEGAARRALEYARRSGDERLIASALERLIGAMMLGTASAEDELRVLADLGSERSHSRRLDAICTVVRAFCLGMQGSLDESRRLYALGIEGADALGARMELAGFYEQLGATELYAGDPVAAERAIRRFFEVMDESGDEGHKSTAAGELARALFALERFDEAEEYAEMALRVAAEDDLASQTAGRSASALVLAARGEYAEAERLAREAVVMFSEAESPNFQADGWMDLATVLRTAGKAADAERAAREALALYERKGNRPAAASTRAFVEELGS